jgi:hypothetical protein
MDDHRCRCDGAGGNRARVEPTLRAEDFTTKITNPYFPLPVGRKLV